MNTLPQVARVAALVLALCAALPGAVPDRARELYRRTDYEGALKLLETAPLKDGPVLLLTGQCYFMQGEFKKAADIFQKAVDARPNESAYYDWLGRALGRRAETSSFLTAPALASRARNAFERAVELAPDNTEAMSDLLEYYIDAPGFMGGGLDKAEALARRIAAVNPAEGYWALAEVAKKRKEYGTAEQQLRRALDLAPQQVGRFVDLARFLSRAGRFQESDETFRKAEAVAPNSPKLLFARAQAYIESGRNVDAARDLLRRYLEAPLTPDDPPRSEALRLLKKAAS